MASRILPSIHIDHYLLLELLPPGDGPEDDDGPVLQDQLRIGSLPQVRVGRALTEVVGGSLQHSLLPALSAVRAAELVLLISSLHCRPGVQQHCVTTGISFWTAAETYQTYRAGQIYSPFLILSFTCLDCNNPPLRTDLGKIIN